MASSNRVRSKATVFASGTSRTATFDEATALDDTHLLVALVSHSSTGTATLPAGWTEIGTISTSTPTVLRVHIWAMQGDGATNSITYTSVNSAGMCTLIGYAGYTSLTPLVALSSFIQATAVDPFPFPDTGTAAGYGVALNMMVNTSTVSQTGATNGWGLIPNATGRMIQADEDYFSGDTDQSMEIDMSATRSGMGVQIVFPLLRPDILVGSPYVDITDALTYTYPACVIGPESSVRRVIVGVSTNSTRTISGVTIGGVTATLDVVQTLAGTAHMVIASAVVPTGTTADIVVTISGVTNALGIGMGVWIVEGRDPTGETSIGNGDPTDLSVVTTAGDAVVAYAFAVMSLTTGVFTWSDGLERFDQDVYSTTTTHSGSDKIATGTTTTFSTSSANTTTLGIAAAYGAPTGPTTHQVSGTVDVVTDSAGDVSIVGGPVTHQVSGVVAVDTASAGEVSGIFLATSWYLARKNRALDPRATNILYSLPQSGISTEGLTTGWDGFASAYRFTRIASGSNMMGVRMSAFDWPALDMPVMVRLKLRSSEALGSVQPALRPTWTSSTGGRAGTVVPVPAGESVMEFTIYASATAPGLAGIVLFEDFASVGSTLDITGIQIECPSLEAVAFPLPPYFDGYSTDTAHINHLWSGVDDASVSEMYSDIITVPVTVGVSGAPSSLQGVSGAVPVATDVTGTPTQLHRIAAVEWDYDLLGG